MPKIINDLKILIISVAKKDLLINGYSALTIRSIAKKCNIAIGTVYNYFPSKEMLVAEIILEDWQNCLNTMQDNTDQAKDISDGLYQIYDVLRKFKKRYNKCWNQYATQANGSTIVKERHQMFCSQISSIVTQLLIRLKITPDEYLADFTTEMLLTLSNNDSFEFSKLEGIIQRLYPNIISEVVL